MKRTWVALGLLGMAFSTLVAQKPISGFFSIAGNIKADYVWREALELKKGTPCTLQFITKLKNPTKGESEYQAVLFGTQPFYIPLDEVGKYFTAEPKEKNAFWTMLLLKKNPDAFAKDEYASLRQEQRLEAERYLSELKRNKLFYDDAYIEDYLQCLLLDMMPDVRLLNREVNVPVVRLLKSEAPDMMMLGNDVLLISTGMLATLDTEQELKALMLREISHYLLDHALVTIQQNINRANRAAFWGAVVDGVVRATEQTLYEHYDFYQPGLLFATNGLVQSLVNWNIAKRMGLDYAPKLETEADKVSMAYMECIGESKDALPSALHKLHDYYLRENDVNRLSKYGSYGTLEERLKEMPKPELQLVDRDFLVKMRSIVSYEASVQDYNKKYRNSCLLAMKNVNNNLASADDFLMIARGIMKQTNTSESNVECLMYLDKADMVSEVEDVNITKMRILLMLRENMTKNAVDMLRKYQSQLDVLYQQPHTEEDAEWITAEHLWAEQLLEKLYLN